jgi:NTE family protein
MSKKDSEKKRPKVALALGAGAARAPALAGVIEVLEKHNIPIDLIVGSSAGAIVGGMYCYYQNAKIISDKVLDVHFGDIIDISWKNIFKILFNRNGLSNEKNFLKMLTHQLPHGNLEDLKIPLVIVATDIETLSTVKITTGNTVKAVLASSAAPPYFSPVEFKGKLLIDGGVSSPVPVEVAKKYNPDIIIAVNISQHRSRFDISNMLQLSYRCMDIAYYHLAKAQCNQADVVIHPKLNIDGTDASHSEELYEIGKKEATKQIGAIKKLLNVKK